MTVGNIESAQLFDAGHKGRGLRATKELCRGDVIFAEASFSAVVFDRCVRVRLLVVVMVIYRVIFLLRNKREELVKVKSVRSSVLVWGCEPTGAPPCDISGGKCCQGVM